MFEIIDVPLDEIKSIDRARKEIGDLETLKSDIKRVGLIYPIILNDNYELCAGGRRLAAFKDLEYKSISCRIIPGLSPEDSLVIELIDNASRKDFTWSEEISLKLKIHESCKKQNSKWGYRDTAKKLGVALGGLTSDFQLAMAIRSIPELADYKSKGKAKEAFKKLHQQAEAVTTFENLSDNDKQTLGKLFHTEHTESDTESESESESSETSESQSPVSTSSPSYNTYNDLVVSDEDNSKLSESQKSDSELPEFIYEICDFETLLDQLPSGFIGFSEIDPPYAINFENIYGKAQDLKVDFTDWTSEELYSKMEILLTKLYDKLIDNSWILCWSGFEHALTLNSIARHAGFSTQRPGFWVKPSGSANNLASNMISDYETYLLFRKGNATFNTDHFKACKPFNAVPSAQKYHPTQKPIPLYREFFRSLCKSGYPFYTPFAGSGMSMITATFFNMTPIGTDLESKYFYQFIKFLKEYAHESSVKKGMLAQLDSNRT